LSVVNTLHVFGTADVDGIVIFELILRCTSNVHVIFRRDGLAGVYTLLVVHLLQIHIILVLPVRWLPIGVLPTFIHDGYFISL
jgi:hypothetical protein